MICVEKNALEYFGHEQARLFVKSFDASFREKLAIDHPMENEEEFVKRKDNWIMKGEKYCQNKRRTSIDFILTENSANIF